MREFAKISPSIWNSKKFQSLESDDAKLAYFYLHTCPSANSVGCFVLTERYAAADLGWDLIRYRKAIDTLCIANLIAIDRDEQVVRIIAFLDHSDFSNTKHAIGAIRIALALPECTEKHNVIKDIGGRKYAKGNREIAEYFDRVSIGYRYTETETETETETSEAKASGADAPPDDPEELLIRSGIALLTKAGQPELAARKIIGKWKKANGTESLIVAISRAQREGATEPVAFIEGVLKHAAKQDKAKTPQYGDTRERNGQTEVYHPFDGWRVQY